MQAQSGKGENRKEYHMQPAQDPYDPCKPNDTKPSLHCKWQDWLPYLEDQDLSEADKLELIETLWSLVVAFVDLGFGLTSDPINCENSIDLKTLLENSVLNSDQANNKKKNQSEANHV